MKATRILSSFIIVAVLATEGVATGQTPMGTAFTYQGQLKERGRAANGEYDFQFALYDAEVGGSPVGEPLEANDVAVRRGLFTVVLDFGGEPFAGEARWLEIGVRPGASSGDYTVLSPRQETTAAPYAIYTLTAGDVSDTSGVIKGIGTPGQIPTFTEARRIGDSVIYQSVDGNIGIDTEQPAEKLDVNGTVKAPAINLNGDERTEWPEIPGGVIVMWSGPLNEIPDGWALCDGTPPTPDLRSKFIRSVPDASTDPGSTGGSETHSHGAGSYTAPAHTHQYSGTTSQGGNIEYCCSENQRQVPSKHTHTHTYSGTTDPGGGGSITGTSAEVSSLPPYYELAFIMKL